MPDLHTAAPALLQGYSEALRNEAQRLAEDSAIVTLDLADTRLDAEVMLDDQPVHVVWELEDSQWRADTDSEDAGLADLAACIALVGLLKDVPVKAHEQPVLKETFQMVLERLLGRQLTPGEEGYVSKIEKRFERVQKVKDIFDQDMVRLHPKWTIQGTDALELWDEAPASALEFWNYVALALHERSLPFPAFLKPATDLDATRKKLQSWKQTKSVPQWVERIRRFTSQRAVTNTGARPVNDVRLLITTSDAKLQGRDADTLRWFTLAPAQLSAVRAEHARGALSLPTEAELLLVASLLQMQHSEIESFRLEIERHTAWLNALFQQTALHTRMVTLDESPFTMAANPLRWSATERDGGHSFAMRLVQHDGSAAPAPLRVLSGAQVLYLAADTVFRGPTWFGEETLAEPSIDIPLEALASSDGIAFLKRLDAPLPPSDCGPHQA